MKIQNFLSFYKHKTFTDILNYFNISNNCIFHDNGDITAIVKIHFTKIDEREKIEAVNRRICDYFEVLENNTEISFYLNRVPDNRKIIIRGGPNNKFVHYINRKREEFYNSNHNMITLQHCAITLKNNTRPTQDTPIKERLKNLLKNKSDFKYTREYVTNRMKTLSNNCDKLVNLFMDEKGNPEAQRLSDIEIIRFLSLLINHEEDHHSLALDDIFNGDIIFNRPEKNYFYNGRYHAFLTIRKRGVPKAVHDDFTSFLFSEEITNMPFTIQNSIILTDKEKEIENIQNMRSFAEAMLGVPGFRKKKLQMQQQIAQFNEIEYICRDEHYRIIELSWTIHLWAETTESLEYRMNQFHTLASSNGFQLTLENANLPCAYQSLFPGLTSSNLLHFRMLSGNSRALMPIMTTPIITDNPKSKSFVYFYNKFNDIVKFDTFDNRCTNWNFLIVGSSGSGKSFFTNQLLFQQMPSTPKIFIVDKGGSYRRLIESLGGTYIAIDYTKREDFSINFFDGPYTQEKEIFLIAVLEQMIVDKSSQYISKAYKSIFQKLIQQAYEDTHNNANDTLTLELFVDNYMAINDQTRRLIPSLEMYIHEGSYASFFRKTKIQKTFEYVCFDLDGLGNNTDIMPIIALAVVNLIWQSIVTDIKRRKLIVIDEAWAALKDSNGLANFIDEIYRTARKHNACIGLVTQSFRDIISTTLGSGIKTNTSFFYFLKNKDDPQTLMQVEDITPYTYEEKIKRLMFVKGKYSEAYMHSPGLYQDILRIRPCMSDYWASTTDSGDKAKILDKTNELKTGRQTDPDLTEIIEALVEEGNKK